MSISPAGLSPVGNKACQDLTHQALRLRAEMLIFTSMEPLFFRSIAPWIPASRDDVIVT